MTPLQQIPAHVRTFLYWTGYVVGCATQLLTLVWVTIAAARPDVDMPLWLLVASAVLAFLTNQLNLLAGSNVSDPSTVAVQVPAGSTTTVTAEVDFAEQPRPILGKAFVGGAFAEDPEPRDPERP